MKFRKQLQSVMNMSGPEWAPCWPNYELLEKQIKELALVPAGELQTGLPGVSGRYELLETSPRWRQQQQQQRRDVHKTTLDYLQHQLDMILAERATAAMRPAMDTRGNPHRDDHTNADQGDPILLGGKAGQIAFFKQLHREVRKVHRFFRRTERQLAHREAHVVESARNVMYRKKRLRHPDTLAILARSIYKLYRELIMLESYAIMSYVAFSRLLHEHDRVTGHATRSAFMKNIVQKANFSHYPGLVRMIERCQELFHQVSKRLAPSRQEDEGDDGSGLTANDQLLFIK